MLSKLHNYHSKKQKGTNTNGCGGYKAEGWKQASLVPRMPAGRRAAELVRIKGLPDNPVTWSAPLGRRG